MLNSKNRTIVKNFGDKTEFTMGSFNNHVDMILPFFTPYLPLVDMHGHCGYPLPYVHVDTINHPHPPQTINLHLKAISNKKNEVESMRSLVNVLSFPL